MSKLRDILPERLTELFQDETQTATANRLNTGQATVSKWKNGTIIPPTETLIMIAERYRISMDWLLGLSDKREIDSFNIEKLTYPMFYNCSNLKRVDFPSSIKHLDAFLAKCPNVEEIYVPEDLHIDCDRRFDSDICFMGSGKRFVSDNEGWPEDLNDIQSNFFAFDGVLYTVPYGGCVSLHRYPAGDERKDFDIPDGVYKMSEYAFYGNPYLRKVTIPESVKSSEEHPIQNCENLESIIFKNKSFRMFSCKDSEYIGWPVGMKGLPRLQDIYLYAEDPDVFCFDIFDGLENISDVTLHVPCSCKKLYQNYEVIYYFHDQYGSLCERKEYSFSKFKSIEEFDPIDFFEEGE